MHPVGNERVPSGGQGQGAGVGLYMYYYPMKLSQKNLGTHRVFPEQTKEKPRRDDPSELTVVFLVVEVKSD